MKLINGNTSIEISNATGSLISFCIKEKEFCAKSSGENSLVTIKLLDKEGTPYYCRTNDRSKINIAEQENGCVISFEHIGGLDLSCTAYIEAYKSEGFSWKLSVKNNSGMLMEWVEFPQIRVANTLKGNGGNSKLFWPAFEGVLVEDAKLRDKAWLKYHEITRQSSGWNGAYPGSTAMQFMAFYDDTSGIYFGAHDCECSPKSFEWYEKDDGIELELRTFCNGSTNNFELSYDTLTLPFYGEWQDAAEIYRSWMEENINLPEKIHENKRIPGWMSDSPIVIIYPIRGQVDTGDMTPNLYYPYDNILPFVDEYAEKTASKIMILLMHWEGTAPWATPYVWPPYGGENEFKKLVSSIHAKGNLIGVYCSGIGWTTKSFLDPSLDFSDKYDETLMCKTPEGFIEQSRVVGPPIREGYDMCPFSEKVGDIVSGEVVSIAKSGCDYAQYFDQNIGGGSSFCYANDHGHPSTPGVWQKDAMIRIFKKVYSELENINSNMILGCENAAAEPFIKYLPFNDLRYPVAFYFGKPVPAYAYLYHEYINNFMGNQCTINQTWDFDKNPESVLFRIAYSFAAGDLMTFVLGYEGKIHWGWSVPWDIKAPEQKPILQLVKNLNAWRKEYKEFLQMGRMVKPYRIRGTSDYTLNLVSGGSIKLQSLISTRWRSPNGVEKQVIVNFLNVEQVCQVDCEKVYTSQNLDGEKYTGSISVPELSAIWVE